jgi:hypothetical protein
MSSRSLHRKSAAYHPWRPPIRQTLLNTSSADASTSVSSRCTNVAPPAQSRSPAIGSASVYEVSTLPTATLPSAASIDSRPPRSR